MLGSDAYAAGQHRGIDVGGSDGSPVRAPASGTVTFVGSLPTYGRGVTILTADGYAVTLVHLGSSTAVKGDVVDEGATVGTMGSSGDAEHPTPSVHLGIRVASQNDGYVDPLGLLPARAPASEASSLEPTPVPAAAPSPAPSPPAVAPPGSAVSPPVADPAPPPVAASSPTPVSAPAAPPPAPQATPAPVLPPPAADAPAPARTAGAASPPVAVPAPADTTSDGAMRASPEPSAASPAHARVTDPVQPGPAGILVGAIEPDPASAL